jgi:hypothetical protein
VQRSAFSLVCYRVAPVALLTGCLVTFNDYPQGDIGLGYLAAGAGNLAGAGGGASAGAGAVSGSGVVAGATSGSGASAGSVSTGGSDVGGSLPTENGGTASEAGAGADSSAAGAPTLDGDPTMIDDFEDGDELIFERQGRKGAWFVSNDGKGTQIPEVGATVLPSAFMLARSGSERGMHTSGGPFQTWGALIGTTLAGVGDGAPPYDLSGYQGLKLWVRTNAMSPMAAKEVRLNLVTPMSGMGGSGGGCMTCGWGFDIPLTSKWVQIDVPFSDLDQVGFGGPNQSSPDLTGVTSIQFVFPEAVSFDLWLDDIQLY